ncbi:MAG: PEP-CTERM sorting domain-containing protein [Verrucomicrobia bacterium]|nr:MAG: PEP-CTERM sorting domain-containing protein [Verrucomicrobiota bacterium]
MTSSVTVTNSFKNINAAIPDGSVTGLEDTRSVSLPSLFAITDLKVRLNVAGGYNGDLYCYLRHDSGFVVLLNRPGRSAANAEGSEQAGLQVCFRQDAAQDVHSYPNRAPAGARLVGEMAPDGRSADPRKCVASSPRTSTLNSFAGLNPSGKWTLFLADVSPGSQSTLVDWSLIITAKPRPAELWPDRPAITLATVSVP